MNKQLLKTLLESSDDYGLWDKDSVWDTAIDLVAAVHPEDEIEDIHIDPYNDEKFVMTIKTPEGGRYKQILDFTKVPQVLGDVLEHE